MRIGLSMLAGILAAVSLFYLMQSLVAKEPALAASEENRRVVQIIDIPPDPPPPPPPPAPPDPPPAVDRSLTTPVLEILEAVEPVDPVDIAGLVFPRAHWDGTGLFSMQPREGGPTVKFAPVTGYPVDAARDGIEGWVDLEFTVLRNGSVANVDVIAEHPRGVFGNHAKRSVIRWKFEPRYVNGEPVEGRLKQRITYEIL